MPKALLVKEPKGELSLEEVEKVSPKAGEVLVENVAVAQNPVDYKQHEYGFWIPSFPHVLGCDVAGTVVEVGEGVTNFKQGDRIFSFTKLPAENKSTGAFQTHTIVTANLSGKIPENVSFEEASTFPLAFFTAVVGLYADLKLPEPGKNTSHKDEPVVIWGGASSVGLFAIQLARESGLKVIAIASKKNHELLKSLGASVTIDYKDANVVDQIRNASNGKLKYIFDTICQSGSTKTAYEALGSERGAIAITLADSAKQEDYPNADIHKTFVGNIYNFDGTRSDAADIGQRFWARLEQDLKNKTFVANPVRVVPKGLLGVSDGFKLHKEGGVSAEKLVYRVKETPGL